MKNIMMLFTMAGAINSWAPPKEMFGVGVDRDGTATFCGSRQDEQSTLLLNVIGLTIGSESPLQISLRRAQIRADQAEENARLERARADFAEGKLRELAVELTSARAENKLLKEEIQSLKAENQLMRGEMQLLRAENQSLRAENLFLRGKVQSLEEQVTALNQKLDDQAAQFQVVVEQIQQALASRGNANSTDEK